MKFDLFVVGCKKNLKNCYMEYIFESKSETVIFDFEENQCLSDHKNASHMTFWLTVQVAVRKTKHLASCTTHCWAYKRVYSGNDCKAKNHDLTFWLTI